MDVTQDIFQAEVLDRSHREPVVVDFWAEWCGPCKALGPVIEEATSDAGVALAKVDVDSNQALANEFGIRGIPAVKAFRNGVVVAEFTGALPKAGVESFLAELTKPGLAETTDDLELKTALEAHDFEAAFELLLARVADDPERTREQMVALFGELGVEHPIVSQYRRRLAAALY